MKDLVGDGHRNNMRQGTNGPIGPSPFKNRVEVGLPTPGR